MAITDALVPVAGLGTRLLPATRSQPKEMLPIVDKPINQYVVEDLVEAGIQDVILVTASGKRSIEEHFDSPNLDLVNNLRAGGESVTLNCGYGRGYSVLETIEAVRRVSGRDFAVQYASRRPGDIMTMVADTSRIRSTLDWTPQYDDLDTIARHALAWERKLFEERHGESRFAASA